MNGIVKKAKENLRQSCSHRINGIENRQNLESETISNCIKVKLFDESGSCILYDKEPRFKSLLIELEILGGYGAYYGGKYAARKATAWILKKVALEATVKWVAKKAAAIAKRTIVSIMLKPITFGVSLAINLIWIGIDAAIIANAINIVSGEVDHPTRLATRYDQSTDSIITDTNALKPGILAPYAAMWLWP
jgi:hypothetical protein